ncbi:Nn.00g017010.m01.CDS01 [Neocucurbitaria sp. VM-36]
MHPRTSTNDELQFHGPFEEEDEIDEEEEDEYEDAFENDYGKNRRTMNVQTMEQFWSELKDPELNESKSARIAFFKKYREAFHPQSLTRLVSGQIHGRNVLYRIAWNGEEAKETPWFLHLLLSDEACHSLLEEMDNRGDNALHLAINNNMQWYIDAVLDSNIQERTIQKILGPVTEEEEKPGIKANCIHTALQMKGFKPSTIIRLIKVASEHTLAAQDVNGLTPLHHAVHYTKCSTTRRLNVIMALIQYGDKAFDKHTLENKASVYEYHCATRKQWEARRQKDLQKKEAEKKPQQKADGQLPGLVDTQKSKGEDRTKVKEEKMNELAKGDSKRVPAKEKEEKKRELAKEQKKDMDPKQYEEKKERAGHKAALAGDFSPSFPIRRASTLGVNQPNEGRQLAEGVPSSLRTFEDGMMTSNRNVMKRASAHSNASGAVPPPSKADEVAKLLKLHYLRSTFRERNANSTSSSDAKAIRVRSHDMALKFLFGENSEHKSICFNFPSSSQQKERKINFEVFEDSFKEVLFDPVLLFVKFGRLELEPGPGDVGPRAAARKITAGAGKTDMGKFFDWLYVKGVRNIIKVTVEDGAVGGRVHEIISHRDEIISESLKRFDIEILDWQKTDLCPLTIHSACQSSTNLRELHLWWSGSNAVLRSWSEIDAKTGIAALRTLEVIHLHEAREPLDSTAYVDEKVKDFTNRLNSSRKDLKYKPIHRISYPFNNPDLQMSRSSKSKEAPSTTVNSPSEKIDEHQWLNFMDTFAEGISQLPKLDWFPNDHLTNQSLPEALRKDVRVALIDDGVNFMYKVLSKNLGPGMSFNSECAFEDGDVIGAPEAFHDSTTGHGKSDTFTRLPSPPLTRQGTLMAYMIRRICPAVKIFVCKLHVHQGETRRPSFSAESALAAVEYAVKNEFDIISMSWTIFKNDSEGTKNGETLKKLQKALVAANENKNILLFCSAPDMGASELKDTYYPFDCTDIPKMFRIGAAKADGTTFPWSGDKHDFILPGENVGIKASHKMISPEDVRFPNTGSSIATALAAGLAALVIHCVRLGAIYNYHKLNRKGGTHEDTTGVSEQTLKVIKKHDAMMQAFDTISNNARKGSGHSNGHRRLGVETFFPKPGEALSKDSSLSPDEKWSKVAKIARDLVSDKMENM